MPNRDPRPEEKGRNPERPQADHSEDRTPSTDLQPEDAGTPASGNSGSDTSAEPAMKQTGKTSAERGSNRR